MKLVFAGTRLGREVVQDLLKKGEKVIVSTATEYGGSLIEPHENLIVHCSKMDRDEMKEFIKKYPIDEIIDATHPYAVNVTNNIKACCGELGIIYGAIKRDSYLADNDDNNIIVMDNYEEACNYLITTQGNILLTIGSNNLDKFQDIDKGRIWVRVLPTSKILSKCENLGYTPKNIIAMQGPFSYNINVALYTDFNIKYIVTKDSGSSGGTDEKIQGALDNQIKVIVIKRP